MLMNHKLKAQTYYQYFSKAPGNQHIASLFAIEKILDIIQLNKPKNILEVGLGIGSFCYSIIDYLNEQRVAFNYYGTEKNEFCLSQLPTNLGALYNQLNILEDVGQVDKTIRYDLVIVDGSDDALDQIKEIISQNGVIFIEGDRKMQVDKFRSLFPNHLYVCTISNYKDPDYGPFDSNAWSGGGKLIYVNPTFKQRMHYFGERIKTAFLQRVIRK